MNGWFLRHRRRIAEIGTGATLYGIFNWLFNYPLYLTVLGWLGEVTGGVVMTCLSFVQCSILLVVFDRMGIDWVGVTYIDHVVEKPNKGLFEKVLVWAVRTEHNSLVGKSTKLLGFAAMSVLVDPFVIAIYYRKANFKGVTKRDWQILTAAVFIGNLWWILRQGILLRILQFGWEYIKQRI